MKKLYINAECSLIEVDPQDVITASPVGDPKFLESGDGREVGWLS